MATNGQFEDFLHDIEPSPTTKKNCADAHSVLRGFLRNHNIFSPWHADTFLSGSYKRDTAIRPKTEEGKIERPDVDIIVVTKHTLNHKPADVLTLLMNTLGNNYSGIRKQARSVGISTATVDMDVVPIIEPQEGALYIPDRKLESWLPTNPPAHTSWTTQVNKETGGRFKPLVKLMKWWRRESPTISKYPKGFVIECITAACMDQTETNYGKLFAVTLQAITDRYLLWLSLGIIPHIDDPGVPGNSVCSKISLSAFEGFCKKAESHAKIASQALAESDSEKTTELWREIFGQRFPKPRSQKSGLLKKAAVLEGLVFPDKPVRPNKPTGFA
jgi:hypothetical protein